MGAAGRNCGGCCCNASLVFHVVTCGLAFNGGTVTVKDGGGNTVATGTTDSSGNYTTPALPCATYNWTISLTGWTNSTGSATITTNGTNVNVNPVMLPATLHLTDVNTTIALTYDALSAGWNGCYTLSKTIASATSGPSCTTCNSATGTTTVSYFVSCTGQYSVEQTWFYNTCCACTCGGAGNQAYGYGSGTCNANGTPNTHGLGINNSYPTTGTANPLSRTCTVTSGNVIISAGGCCNAATITAPANGTVTVTL